MKLNTKTELVRIERVLAKSKTSIPLPVLLKMSTLMLNLMKRRKKFGMLVILGWKSKWQRYADTPDTSQDVFARHHINIMKTPAAGEQQRRGGRDGIVNTVNFDGAILIDARGNVLHSGTMIEGLRPRATAHKLRPRRAPDLSTQFGFRRKVHMRHITAITSSYTFRGSTVFTISEETGDFHIFEGGKILYSTVPKEMKREMKRIKKGHPAL